jgi:hypothetical protein
MKKKVFLALIAVLSMTATVVAQAQSTPGLAFTLINNNTAYSVGKGTATATAVVIPAVYEGKPVTQIADGGFLGYTAMTSVTIPNSVTSIGVDAFAGCRGLTGITIPNNVTSIGSRAFTDCIGLTSVTIGNGVTSIGWGVFSGCIGLTSVTIPNSVTSIGRSAFSGCIGLTSVTIPNSVTSIGEAAFYGCSGLTAINVTAGNGAYTAENGVLYNKNKTVLVAYPAGKAGSFTIPTGVTSIGSRAFYGCTGLTSVTIPNSVTSIGEAAFYGCTGLTSVTFQGTITPANFSDSELFPSFPGDLRDKYLAANGGIGTYTRPNGTSNTWTKQ